MSNSTYRGIFPAFYAPYTAEGEINLPAARAFTAHLIDRGVNGLYVCGSSGECLYQSVPERKVVLEAVLEEAIGRVPVIAHVAANNTKDSVDLAAHAAKVGATAIAAIPPIYFKLPEAAIAAYWNAISEAAGDLDFFIYNIPQLAGVALTPSLLETMLENPHVVGVKNSSMPALDIQTFLTLGGPDFTVFNGPDEQLLSGLAVGAAGGIGGTYAAFPELYLAIYKAWTAGDPVHARHLQELANEYITLLCGTEGNMYATAKWLVKHDTGIDLGSVRAPLLPNTPDDNAKFELLVALKEKIQAELAAPQRSAK